VVAKNDGESGVQQKVNVPMVPAESVYQKTPEKQITTPEKPAPEKAISTPEQPIPSQNPAQPIIPQVQKPAEFAEPVPGPSSSKPENPSINSPQNQPAVSAKIEPKADPDQGITAPLEIEKPVSPPKLPIKEPEPEKKEELQKAKTINEKQSPISSLPPVMKMKTKLNTDFSLPDPGKIKIKKKPTEDNNSSASTSPVKDSPQIEEEVIFINF